MRPQLPARKLCPVYFAEALVRVSSPRALRRSATGGLAARAHVG
jgi:hypothetical protein